MISLQILIAASETEPEFDETLVTPGPLGFTIIAIVAIAAILLILDMTRRIRRNTYRGIVQEELMSEVEASLRENDPENDSLATESSESSESLSQNDVNQGIENTPDADSSDADNSAQNPDSAQK